MFRLRPLRPICILLLIGLALPCGADPAPDRLSEAQRGAFFANFTSRSELSKLPAMFKRYGRSAGRKVEDYELEKETFKVIVPESYEPTEAFGVLVFISPADEDRAMGDAYATILAKHKLIFVGALNSGNKREAWHRFALALDGLHNIGQQYNVDPQRTYVCGMSGGGRVASRLGILYADVFSGALPICGCDYFRNVPVPGDPTKMWRARFNRPAGPVLVKAKRRNRYVLLTGEKDGNRLETLGVFRRYRQDRFAYVKYLEVPEMGHQRPPADWFEKALVQLDAPLAQRQQAR